MITHPNMKREMYKTEPVYPDLGPLVDILGDCVVMLEMLCDKYNVNTSVRKTRGK